MTVASVKFTRFIMLILSLKTANQSLDRLRKELHGAFLRWRPIRRNTKRKLEELKRNLPILRDASHFLTTATAASESLSPLGILAAPFTAGGSLMLTFGIKAVIGTGLFYVIADTVQKKLRSVEVQVAIDEDRRACADLIRQLDSLNRTFASSTEIFTSASVTVGVPDALTRASRFVDPSVLPWDITKLVTSSFVYHGGSIPPIVDEIRGILANLECPDETETQLLVESFIAEAEYAEV